MSTAIPVGAPPHYTQPVQRPAEYPQSSSRTRTNPFRPGPPMRWELVGLTIRRVAWNLLAKGLLAIVYLDIVSEGLRHLVHITAKKIHTVPGFGALRRYAWSHQIDSAQLLALFLLLFVFFFWGQILELWLMNKGHDQFDDRGWRPETHRALLVTLGTVILGADVCLFYTAITWAGWRGSRFSVPALLATCAYLAIIVAVCFVSLTLKKSVTDLKHKEK